MTELQKRPAFNNDKHGLGIVKERDYYKARCAVAEEALQQTECMCICLPEGQSCGRCSAIERIAASETP